MANRRAYDKGESIIAGQIVGWQIAWRGGRAGYSVAIGEPVGEIAVAAAGRAERGELFAARFAADRAGAGGPSHGMIVWT